ncbi:hypothetical protein C9374_010310 [Naegleria lovaniensis]|uniref:sphinganine-1-phosphate aldolase n=1 Tax=Naegleria lovaniensis TaxID=51637 RepID=A0AA88GE92_NAELO|nr:uncharacterized protein C9374_010310 [Naegleria lovaniensis]KAG2374936.1 hypothetical protein C9374_010310 [Naegleria lovaniensis]
MSSIPSSSSGLSNNTNVASYSSFMTNPFQIALRKMDELNDQLKHIKPLTLMFYTATAMASAYYGKQLWEASKEHPNGLSGVILGMLLKTVRKLPMVDSGIQSTLVKISKEIKLSFKKGIENEEINYQLPVEGIPYEELLSLLQRMRDVDRRKVQEKKLSGVVYIDAKVDNEELNKTEEKNGDRSSDPLAFRKHHEELLAKTYSYFMHTNPLHADCFLYTRKMESEVIRMTAAFMNGPFNKETGEGVVGAVTSGGTESIIMALKSYRDQARAEKPWIKHPEVIAPRTVHCAFEKGCHYLGLKLRLIDVDLTTFKVKMDLVRQAINSNTILLVGSAPCFSQGTIDPIDELNELAVKHGIGLHVDCCLGGFVVPFAKKLGYDIGVKEFDFTLPGVTTISVDTHKFGMAPKGSSVLLFRNKDLRKYMYFVTTDWMGGVYASPTMSGSRSGAVVAAAWASMMHIGEKGYLEASKRIVNTVLRIKKRITEEIPEVEVCGNPSTVVIAVQTKSSYSNINIFQVMDFLSHRGWSLNALQFPSAFHICITLNTATDEKADEFILDLKDAVAQVKNNPDSVKGSAPVYGLAVAIPDRSLIASMVTNVVDAMLDV